MPGAAVARIEGRINALGEKTIKRKICSIKNVKRIFDGCSIGD